MVVTNSGGEIPGSPDMQVSLLIKLIDETPTNSFLSVLYYLSFALISGGGESPWPCM
jgi:hypothetical protein